MATTKRGRTDEEEEEQADAEPEPEPEQIEAGASGSAPLAKDAKEEAQARLMRATLSALPSAGASAPRLWFGYAVGPNLSTHPNPNRGARASSANR